MANKKYNFYSDPSHGWMRVPLKDFKEVMGDDFGVISAYSYMSSGTLPRYVYLEEDRDMSIFIDKLKERGDEYTLDEKNSNNPSSIRSYDSFNQYRIETAFRLLDTHPAKPVQDMRP